MAARVRSEYGSRIESMDGENALPAPHLMYLAYAMQLAFYAGIACALLGFHTHLPEPMASFVAENKGQTMMCLFIFNVVSSQLLSTGAFEVFVNDKLVFSKLQTGHVPKFQHLIRLVGENLAK